MEFFDTLCRVIFYFMIYSVVGWIYETTLCSITDRHFVNRGFLNGPYCRYTAAEHCSMYLYSAE